MQLLQRILLGLALLVVACLAAPFKPVQLRQETDPELTAGYFEGDIVLGVSNRNGLRNETEHWPNKTVYYKFHTKFDDAHRNHILLGMRILEEKSCIRFKEADSEQRYFVNITGFDGGCYSDVGWLGKDEVQQYNLQIYPLDEGCFRLGTIVHEFLHTLGFFHQQSAANRDDYVRIILENIQPGYEDNFEKYTEEEVDDYDQEYDYGSVLHYPPYAFSANNKMTIVPHKLEMASIMGQRRGMSKIDINKLNVMYRCPVNA